MTRYLLIAAVLAGGCEQLKSPERIHELEDRVDKLSQEVQAMKSGATEMRSKPGAAGAGSGAGSDEHGEGSGSDEPVASAEGTPEPTGAGSGEHAGSGESAEPAAGSAAGADKVASAEGAAAGANSNEHGDDAGKDKGSGAPPVDKAERALAELRAVVERATGGGKSVLASMTRPGDLRAAAALAAPPHWSYDDKTGPEQWGTMDPGWRTCAAGKAQSPIDIEPRAGTASPIIFHYQATQAALVDDGHTLQVNLTPGSTIEIGTSVYQLVQFHFHAPSEHTIAGEHYPLELHLVHQDADGRYAVISVLYDTGPESRPLGGLWSRWPRKVGAEERLRKFDPNELLPDTRSVFRYAGSLTTPPCTEGVVWNVMRRAMTDSKPHLEGFARHYAHNARELQPRNDRRIE